MVFNVDQFRPVTETSAMLAPAPIDCGARLDPNRMPERISKILRICQKIMQIMSQMLHVWNIYLHLAYKSPKCR